MLDDSSVVELVVSDQQDNGGQANVSDCLLSDIDKEAEDEATADPEEVAKAVKANCLTCLMQKQVLSGVHIVTPRPRKAGLRGPLKSCCALTNLGCSTGAEDDCAQMLKGVCSGCAQSKHLF